MCFTAYFAVKTLGFKRASVLLPLALSTSSLSQQQQYAFYYYRVRHGKLVFFKSALIDKNMQVKFISFSWDLRNFATTTSSYEMYTVHHLWSNLQTGKLIFLENKIWISTTIKLFHKIEIQCFGRLFMSFCFKLWLRERSCMKSDVFWAFLT